MTSTFLQSVRDLKNATAHSMVAAVDFLAAELQSKEAEIKSMGGPRLAGDKICVTALLAVILDEMSYTPDAVLRSRMIGELDSACEQLRIDRSDVDVLTRHAGQLTTIFAQPS